jgi:hypothetical protein
MGARKASFAGRVRAALQDIGQNGAPVTFDALGDALDLVGKQDKLPMYNAIRDLTRTGEVERAADGAIVYRGISNGPEIRDAMWSVIRMRRTVSVYDLQELAGASKNYALEFLRLLARRGAVEVVKRPDNSTVYRLVADTGRETPQNSEKADQLRQLRAAKKEALKILDTIGPDLIAAMHKIVRARQAIADIEEAGNETV